jgi:hypothetical protein
VEIFKLYASDQFACVALPGRRPVGFSRVHLAPDERWRIRINAARLDLL